MSFCMEKNKKEFDRFLIFLEENKDVPGGLMPILQEAQRVFGYIPEPIVDLMALKLKKPSSEIYGVASFYSQFTFEAKGKHEVCVCLGTACYVKGADELLDSLSEKLDIKLGQTTSDGEFTLSETRCVGECGLAPVLTVDGENIGPVKEIDLDQILFNAQGGKYEKN